MNRLAKETYSVLIADDSTDDRLLLRTAMRRATKLQIVAEAGDGAETVDYLRNCRGGHKKHPAPDLLLLDLKMPVMDGFGVLEWLRARQITDLTVVVLTDSMRAEHIHRALQLGADLFQVKPQTNREREAMVLALENHVSTARHPLHAAA